MTDDEAEIRELFVHVIPELAEGVIEIQAIAQKGIRTKVAIFSRDPQFDCVAACVGVRGDRIRRIVNQAGGERIDLVKWSESIETFIANALQPAEVVFVQPDRLHRRARVYVHENQVSLALGRRGQNQRLASALCGLEIEIVPLHGKGGPQ